MDAVVRVKDERLHIVQDALALFKCRKANKGWIITTNKVILVEILWKTMHKGWDIENNAFHQLKIY